ncbi:DUF1015 domain-containing protein [Leeuwenhoekiella marinoflava]|uniref:DUF1015 domain-containing protein n=2 Tax=Leeuwenhoekiella marinoflava TaxID=988 RepID=A0A4Q0PSG8_9FLAO|nr:DUF1015 domain-containing protein [Leeuwenhoekiella marinoflava]RXG32885.1 putative protein (DUF1015 family) [Leeuwenhoekiella marinoflava]SHE60288.1 Uncharacterized conserved protein, DUF1015 family [Leeuwenhoekiella marinoflava DSM 3653]
MPKIIPFKAVRPTRDKVSLIASRSYDTYTKSERKARLENNPYSFLHIVNPGYKYHKVISGEERFKLVRNRYLEFKEEGIFIEENQASFYVYKIVNRDAEAFVGIIAAASVADYQNNHIKRHENTIKQREEVFKEYLKTTGFNAEPVLLTHPDSDELSKICELVMQERSEYEFTTTYRDTHYLWPVCDKWLVEKIEHLYAEMPELYIADGHHRSSSSALLADDLNEQNTESTAHNYFMSYIIPESHLRVHAFSRMITDLCGMDSDEFLIQLDSIFKIENRGEEFIQPTALHHFSMYLAGNFYTLELRKQYQNFTNALESLDAQILYELVLKPMLQIENPREDKRLAYGKGKNDMLSIKEKVDQQKFAVAFGLFPATSQQIKDISNEGLTMPPKSTFIQPKLRSGVTIYEFL